MKMVSVGIATVGFFLLFALAPTRMEWLDAQTVISQAATLKNAIVHDMKKERWWMLLFGATIVAYRLLRKHQAMFESTYLYPASVPERRALMAANEAELELDTVPIKRIAGVS